MNAIKAIPQFRDFDEDQLTAEWDSDVIPNTIEYVKTNNLKGGARQYQRIAIAYYLTKLGVRWPMTADGEEGRLLDLDELDATGTRSLYSHPLVMEWHRRACTGGLD